MPINYTSGDATCPQGRGRTIIAHICNDRGAWSEGPGDLLPLTPVVLAPKYQRTGTGPRVVLEAE